jgi:tRNA pseudouridine55 synthase
MDKVYTGRMFVGATTPSYDKETEINQRFDVSRIKQEELEKARKQFIGEISQTPPVYSAVKIAGKRAFDYARKNTDISLKSRNVIIHEFQLLNTDMPEIDFTVKCSKGTYIRSLVDDFGKALNNGAYLTQLVRTQIGEYRLSDALTIEEFKKMILNQQNPD